MVEVKYKSLFKIPMFFYSIIPLFVFAGVPFWGILKAFFDMYNVGMNIESVKFFFFVCSNACYFWSCHFLVYSEF